MFHCEWYSDVSSDASLDDVTDDVTAPASGAQT